MLNKLLKKSDRGFTLIELMVVLFIVSIIAAIAAPSLLGMLNRFYVKEAMLQINGAVKESQRQSMRRGKLCRVNINPNTNLITGEPTDCLLKNRSIRKRIKIKTNIPGSLPSITFSHKGSTTKMGTIVVSSELTNMQKCFVISLGIGITRTGDYQGSETGSVSAKDCSMNRY